MAETKKQRVHHLPRLDTEEMLERGALFLQSMQARRSIRQFSAEPVPRAAIELAVRVAGTAPSGANQQPWTFVVVDDPELKRRIRLAAEKEEREFYDGRAPVEWLEALTPLGTTWEKPFLETAPYLIVVFLQAFGLTGDGERSKHYYTTESVGIATGLLLVALHQMGLATLTHTPSPMGFLKEVLERPSNERPYLLIPTGYPAPGATVPNIERKTLDQILVHNVAKPS